MTLKINILIIISDKMKIKNICLLTLILLFILIMGTVSAQDNLENSSEKQLNESYEVISEDNTNISDNNSLNEIYLSNDHVAKGRELKFVIGNGEYYPNVMVDGKKVECLGDDENDVFFSLSTKGLDIGQHSFYISTSNFNKTIPFWIDNIVVRTPDVINLNNYIYGNEMIIELAKGCKDTVSVTVDGKTKTYKSDYIEIDLTSVKNTNIRDYIHEIIVDYPKGNYHEIFNVTAVYSIYSSYDNLNFTYRKFAEFEFTAPEGLSLDRLIATVDGNQCEIIDYDYIYELIIPDTLSIGQHTVNITYLGDDKYYKNTFTTTINIVPMIELVGYETWNYGEEYNIILQLPENATGSLNVYMNNNLFASSEFTDGISKITLKNILPGSYNFTAKYNGSDYEVADMVFDKDILFYYWLLDINIDENPTCYLRYIPNEIKDNIIINFEGKNYTGQYNNDILEITTSKVSKIGDYIMNLLYVENGTVMYDYEMYLRVFPSCNVPLKITGDNNAVTVNATGGKGSVTLIASNDNEYYCFTTNLTDGKASFSLSKLNGGTYDLYLVYDLEDMYVSSPDYSVKVYNYKLSANDLTKYYGSSSNFKVKVCDYKGKIIKSKYVKLYISGKYVKKVKTNTKGIATFKIDRSPGNYIILVRYDKVEITRNLKVKHLLSLKTVKVKRTAKKLILSATLKAGKKVYKFKKIKFNFNGKTYIAKTNYKGVAKVIIKKSALKKLKDGQTVKYQAKYSKDIVKKVTSVI